ncbi:MAG: uroporphyrinogen decarboxylase family protein [Defluviitaleaceae bacterium]|nr:uroporphyrinogen decarboxylase family protein [Defluviitaleaceae bacterium]
MKHKDRFIAAMEFRQPDDMAAMFEIEFQIYKEYVGEDPVSGFEYAKLSPKEKEMALGRNAELFVQAADKAGHDAIRDLGSYWEISPGKPALLWLPEIDDRAAQIRAIKREAGDEFFIFCTVGGMAGCIPDGDNLYKLIQRVYEQPDEVRLDAELTLESILRTQQIFAEAGADGVINATDIAFNTGTFFSPEQLREFFFPYLTKWAGGCRDAGLVSVLHTDGNVSAVMDDIMASGVNALQCVDPLGGMDIVELKKQVYGRLALIGNLDCSLLQLGPREEIESACENILMGCKEGGGFAFGGCNAIFKGIPAENYQVMVDARKKYGRYAK